MDLYRKEDIEEDKEGYREWRIEEDREEEI